MWPVWAFAVLAIHAGAEPTPPAVNQLAISPNISIGTCADGQPLNVGGGSQQVQGRLEGRVSGEAVFGNYCTGFYEERAHYCFVVPPGGAQVSLELLSADVDTTLAVYNDDLEWPLCDDDGGSGLLSRIDQHFDAGTYRVHVGSFSPNQTSDFVMEVGRGTER